MSDDSSLSAQRADILRRIDEDRKHVRKAALFRITDEFKLNVYFLFRLNCLFLSKIKTLWSSLVLVQNMCFGCCFCESRNVFRFVKENRMMEMYRHLHMRSQLIIIFCNCDVEQSRPQTFSSSLIRSVLSC